jgi:hypothetical protein
MIARGQITGQLSIDDRGMMIDERGAPFFSGIEIRAKRAARKFGQTIWVDNIHQSSFRDHQCYLFVAA